MIIDFSATGWRSRLLEVLSEVSAPPLETAIMLSDGPGPQLSAGRGAQAGLLLGGLRPALALSAEADITWHSPRAADDFAEYRDMEALRRLRIESLPEVPLGEFWPRRGPVWDAFGKGAIHFAPERGFGYAPCLN